MAPHHTSSGLGVRQVTTATLLLCFLLHLAWGFSLAKADTEATHSDRVEDRVKREVYPGYQTLCKANPRNCDPMALIDRRSQNQWTSSNTVTHPGPGQSLSQNKDKDEALYRLIERSLALIGSSKPADSTMCRHSPRTCQDGVKRVASGRQFWKRLLQNDKSEMGFGGAVLSPSERQLKEQAPSSDLMEKLQASISNWQRMRLAEKEPSPEFEQVADQDDFYKP